MVPDNKQFLDLASILQPPSFGKEPVEYVAMVLHLAVLPPVRPIANMHERVDITLLKELHRIRDVGKRKAAMRSLPVLTEGAIFILDAPAEDAHILKEATSL